MDQTLGTGPPAVWPSCSILDRRLRPRAARLLTGLSRGGTGGPRHLILGVFAIAVGASVLIAVVRSGGRNRDPWA